MILTGLSCSEQTAGLGETYLTGQFVTSCIFCRLRAVNTLFARVSLNALVPVVQQSQKTCCQFRVDEPDWWSHMSEKP